MASMLAKKQILRQRTNSQIGYDDWTIRGATPWFTESGEAWFQLERLGDGAIEGFTAKEIAEMEVVGTTLGYVEE